MNILQNFKIVTHNGIFHTDEVLAIAMYKIMVFNKNIEIIRTRDPNIIKNADVLIDVGGIYDSSLSKFDHHQRDFNEFFLESKITKLSSAGLVYFHYGTAIIQKLYPDIYYENIDTVWKKLYHKFIEAIDAIDNGVNQYPEIIQPLYINETTLYHRISRLNGEPSDDVKQFEQFKIAIELCKKEFIEILDDVVKKWLPNMVIIKNAFENRFNRIIEINSMPEWDSILKDCEKSCTDSDYVKNNVLFAIYNDKSQNSWKLHCVSGNTKFEQRLKLPKIWGGLTNEDLQSAVGGPEGAVFCHIGGFMAGHRTREGVIFMANEAMRLSNL